VNQLVAQVIVDKGSTRCPEISVVVGEPLELVVDKCEHSEAADIKLSLVVKCGLFNVLLHDEGLLFVVVALTEYAFDFAKRRAYCDSIAPIGVFTRLYDPNVTWGNFIIVCGRVFLPLLIA